MKDNNCKSLKGMIEILEEDIKELYKGEEYIEKINTFINDFSSLNNKDKHILINNIKDFLKDNLDYLITAANIISKQKDIKNNLPQNSDEIETYIKKIIGEINNKGAEEFKCVKAKDVKLNGIYILISFNNFDEPQYIKIKKIIDEDFYNIEFLNTNSSSWSSNLLLYEVSEVDFDKLMTIHKYIKNKNGLKSLKKDMGKYFSESSLKDFEKLNNI